MQKKVVLNKKNLYFTSAFLLLVAAAIAWRAFTTWQQRQVVEREIGALEREVERYKQSNEKLEESLRELGGLSAQEKTVREELDMKRTGEVVLRFAENPKKPEAEPQENRKKWIDYLFGD